MKFSHPAFAPYRELLADLGGEASLEALDNLASRLNRRHASHAASLRFAASHSSSAADYEKTIAASGIVPSRENNLHDFLNALVWLRFPQLKSALNLRHCQALEQQPGEHKLRGRLRDQLTLLDESGMLVISARPDLLELLREKKWIELFWDQRAEVARHMHFIVVGHGLLEKCLAPFPGMTAKCLFLHTPETGLDAIDSFAAMTLRDAESLELPPLPVQGVPGWDKNETRAYYQNTEVFRPARTPYPAA
jgi:hypothetical protein